MDRRTWNDESWCGCSGRLLYFWWSHRGLRGSVGGLVIVGHIRSGSYGFDWSWDGVGLDHLGLGVNGGGTPFRRKDRLRCGGGIDRARDVGNDGAGWGIYRGC